MHRFSLEFPLPRFVVPFAANSGVALYRSLVFLFPTGEEAGLLGSQFYATHPFEEVSTMVAAISFDVMNMYVLLLRFLAVVLFATESVVETQRFAVSVVECTSQTLVCFFTPLAVR